MVAEKGSYTITLHIALDLYPHINTSTSLTLNVVDRCETTTYSTWTIPDMNTYIFDSSPAIQDALIPTDSVSLAHGNQDGYTFCGARTLAMNSSPLSFLTFDSTTTPHLSAITNNVGDTGTYTVNLQVTLDNYPTLQTLASVTLNVIDRCTTTSISAWTIPDITTYVKDSSPAIQDGLIPTDSVSLAYGNQDGFTFCGARTLTMTSSSHSFLTFNPTTVPHLSAITNNIADASTYTITLQIQLDLYPTIT